VQPGSGGPSPTEAEPLGGIVIAAAHQHPGACVEQPVESLIEQVDGVDAR
jgi:hypothetical protein